MSTPVVHHGDCIGSGFSKSWNFNTMYKGDLDDEASA